MLTKGGILYQVKLILDYLPDEEYQLIPQDTIDFIENNFEYDENITINPDIPLEEQNIDDKTYEMLDKILKSAENNKANDIYQYIENVKKQNKEFGEKIENIKLKNIVEMLKKENEKIPKAKELLEEYKMALQQKEREIERLKENNQNLYEYIQRIPGVLRKIFIKDNDIKLLINSKNQKI